MKIAPRSSWRRADREWIEHDPVWAPTMLPVNAAGDLRPGFECVHPLENGNGQCGGNVFTLDQAVGRHACIGRRADNPRHRMRIAYRRRWRARARNGGRRDPAR